MKEKELEPIEIRCVICDSLYETLYVVEDGCPYDFCCSILCYNQYHSLPYITLPSQRVLRTRERKIDSIIDYEK
jgi:hypothetical protein